MFLLKVIYKLNTLLATSSNNHLSYDFMFIQELLVMGCTGEPYFLDGWSSGIAIFHLAYSRAKSFELDQDQKMAQIPTPCPPSSPRHWLNEPYTSAVLTHILRTESVSRYCSFTILRLTGHHCRPNNKEKAGTL